MCKSKHSFTLWSIFFILMMGTFAYQTNKSTPDRARHMVNVLEEGGQSRRTTSFGFPFPEDAEVHNREMMHNHKKPVEFRARKINPVAAFEGFLEDTINRCLGELGYWLSDLGLFPLERRRMKGPDCTLDNPPKVSEAHGTEDNNIRFNEINSQSPIRQMGKTSPAIRGQVDQNESDIVDNRSSGKEVKRLQKMVKDGQRTGLDENADSCRVNETEVWPDQRKGKTRRALLGQVDQSESDIIDKRSSGKEVKRPHKMVKDGQRTGLDENADSCRVNETEFYRAAMEQRISYAFLAIALLAGLTFVCFALRHWTKQPTQKEEVFDTPCNPKNTEDIVRHKIYEPASRNWNLSTPEDGLYKVKQQLARYTNLQLSRVTESCYEQLKPAMDDVVEHISESLISKWRMSEINLEKIRTLIRNNQRRNASQYTLESILGGDTGNCRMFWNVLSETQINPQYLMKLLTQDIERDVKHRHRCNLRSQSRKLNLLKPRLISDMYTEPTITVIQHEHANVTRESNAPTGKVENPELFRPSNRDSDRSTISVVCGPAGTGKTTLIQKLIYDWATGMKHEEFSFVLHFKIQNLKAMKGLITLNRLTLDVYPYMENYLDHLWNEPKKLLFIFDDLDQLYPPLTLSDAGRNSDPRYRCTDTESEHLVGDIVRCLLQGEFLRGCSVLITTRVWNLELLDHVTADSNFQVLGFTTKKAKEYFCRYLCNRQNANQIVELIEQNEILWNMCRNPLFCVTLASSLVSCQAQGGQITIPIVSHTKVLSDYVTHLLAKCGYNSDINRKCLIVVGELAEKGIRQSTLSFEGDSLRVLDSCPPMFISAFMYQDPDKQSGGVIYEFRHSVLRDFLAALTNVLNAPTSRLKRIIDERSTDVTGRFSTFSIFLVGLSSRKSTDRLEKELQSFPTEVTSCISEWLTQSVSRRLTDMDTKHTQKMFLSILYSLLEFGDNDIVTEVLNTITSIKLNQLRLKSPDYIVLSRTLNSLEVIQELDLSSCFAQPEEIWKLEQLLPRCVILRLNQNNLQDSGMKRLFDVLNRSKVKTLTLQSNHLTDNCLESVFSALTKNPSLMQLNLSNSSQDEKQANQFTVEKLKYHYERSTQQKEIKWLRIKNIGQDFTRSSRESNCLTLITD